jgi:uncharacterized protein (DUF58 family)
MPGRSKYLDPKVLNRIGRMELKARLVVEGFISGQHKSPYHGFSVEFAEHREYVPGDDLRHVDWKVWSKTDRYFIKQYEEETNLTCYICLDTSASMTYASPAAGGVSKLEYGCYIAASLAFLLTSQQDAAALALFDGDLRKFLPPSTHPSSLVEIGRTLEAISPKEKSDMEPVLRRLAEKLTRRGVVVVISDLFTPPDSLIRGLKHLRHKRHEVIVFHVMDPYERSFPFQRMTLFEGLEGEPELLTEPRALRREYLEALAEFERAVRTGCSKCGIDYLPLTTDMHLDAALASFLAKRLGK